MSSVRLAAIWVASLLLAATVLAGLERIAAGASLLEIPAEPIIAIGSSAFRHAFPPSAEGAQSILGDGRAHLRLAKGDIDEREELDLLEQVLKGSTQTVLLDINPFAFDFARFVEENARFAPRVGTQLTAELIEWSRDLDQGLARRRHAQTEPLINSLTEEAEIDKPFEFEREKMRLVYPLHLRGPYHLARLAELIARARSRGIEIVLVALPRAHLAAQFFGPDGDAELQSHLVEIARQLGLPLFATETFWPDPLFVDNGHLNRAGRARFLVELREWWQRRHDA